MKDFMFIFRSDANNLPKDPEAAAAMTKRWMDWIGSIAAEGKLADRGNRLAASGMVLKPEGIMTNGPYTEIKESIGGYSMVKAESYEAAAEIAKGCPALLVGGSVEIREIDKM